MPSPPPRDPWTQYLDAVAADLDSADQAARDNAAHRLTDIMTARRTFWSKVADSAILSPRTGRYLLAVGVGLGAIALFVIGVTPSCDLGCVGVFASVGMILPGVASQLTRRNPATEQPRGCRRCGYDLDGLAPLHPFEEETGVLLAPRACPECACPWPRFPPPKPD